MLSTRLLLILLLLVGVAFIVAQGVVHLRMDVALGMAFVIAVFVFVFVRSDAGLYLVLFSMLLSPEFAIGSGLLAERRAIVVRLEDLLLIAIALSWCAKMAVNKDLGIVVKTPLNRWILAYVVTSLAATLTGYLTGTVQTTAGFFYVLKYVEYFVVYYMTVNNLRDREQAWRLVITAFITAAIVSVIGIGQIPSGQRVSAPFEGEAGEPNTLGGYLLFMMAVAGGLALESRHFTVRLWSSALVALMSFPFLFTLSRASYLGVVPAVITLTALSTKRRVLMGLLVIIVMAAPLLAPSLLPTPVSRRIVRTFEAERTQNVVRLGRITFDTSTSDRLISSWQAVEGWMQRPLLGYGVTGFKFLDAQYARTLVETGVIGFAAFLGLLIALVRSTLAAYRRLSRPDDRGIALGVVAGTVGLCFHAIGSNSFIIIRIMEPFWFFVGVVLVLPTLPAAADLEPVRVRPAVGALR